MARLKQLTALLLALVLLVSALPSAALAAELAQAGETAAQEAEEPTQAGETAAQEAEAPSQGEETAAQEAEEPTQAGETAAQEAEAPSQGEETAAQEADEPAQAPETVTEEAEAPTQAEETPAQEAEAPTQAPETVAEAAANASPAQPEAPAPADQAPEPETDPAGDSLEEAVLVEEVEAVSVTQEALGVGYIGGICGEGLDWSLNLDGILTIMGEGCPMYDYNLTDRLPPWYEYREHIVGVRFEGGGPTGIGSYAFANLTLLTTITLPNSVAAIGPAAFYGCTSLTEINLPEGNEHFYLHQGVVYARGNTKHLVCCPPGLEGSPTVADSVTVIDEGAFAGCRLAGLYTNNAVQTIHENAFLDCQPVIHSTSLKNASITYAKAHSLPYRVLLQGCTVSVDDQTYTGNLLTPKVKVFHDGGTLSPETDYDVAYENNTAVGKATVIVTGKGIYEGTVTGSFAIRKPAVNIKAAKVTAPNQVYSGKALKPDVTVAFKGKVLKQGTDYTVTYKNNVKVGKATIIVEGKGQYTGTAYGSFLIYKLKTPQITSLQFKGKAVTVTVPKVKGAKYCVYHIDSKGKLHKIRTSSSNVIPLKNLKKGRTYTLTVRYLTNNGKAASDYDHYGVKIVIKGKQFKLVSTTVKSLTNIQNGMAKIVWKRPKNMGGNILYHIQYSTDPVFTNAKTIQYKSKSSTLSYKVKNLTCGKTYYFRVSYRINGSWSPWSNIKKIKITK